MTGDAILSKDLDKNEANDLYKCSPTKVSSKLSPMPTLPIFVEREQDYNRRLNMMKGMMADKSCQDKSEENSPSSTTPIPTTSRQ